VRTSWFYPHSAAISLSARVAHCSEDPYIAGKKAETTSIVTVQGSGNHNQAHMTNWLAPHFANFDVQQHGYAVSRIPT